MPELPQSDLWPGILCLACKLSQHLLEVRPTETSTCYMTERTGGEPEEYSSTTLYRSTPGSTTLHSSTHRGPTYCVCKMTSLTISNKERYSKAFRGCCFTGHAPNTQRGRGFRLKHNVLWSVSTSAVLLLERNTDIWAILWLMSMLTTKPAMLTR